MAEHTIPPKPAVFSSQGTAPGCRRIPNLYERPLMGRAVDVLVVHTNWAGGEGSIESSVGWARAKPGSNTYPHYQHDRDGDAGKLLDSHRRGIGNAGSASYWRDTWGLPDASYRALVFETADRGTNVDPAPVGSWFTDAQMGALARDLAYECVTNGIPPKLLPAPNLRGIAGHTSPFPYPAFTTASTKRCPGYRKLEQLPELIAWTSKIVTAWTAVAPVPPPPSGRWTISSTGVFRLSSGDSPWRVASVVYGNGARYNELEAANPNAGWYPGETIWVPNTAGVLGKIRDGDTVWGMLRDAYPGESPADRDNTVLRWLGAPPYVLKAGDPVFLPVAKSG